MFALLLNGDFYGFWGNKVGDIFIDNTIKNLNLNPSQVKLLYFPQISNVPELFEVASNKLIIKNKVTEVDYSDAENPVTIEILEKVNEYEGEVYFENGLQLKVC